MSDLGIPAGAVEVWVKLPGGDRRGLWISTDYWSDRSDEAELADQVVDVMLSDATDLFPEVKGRPLRRLEDPAMFTYGPNPPRYLFEVKEVTEADLDRYLVDLRDRAGRPFTLTDFQRTVALHVMNGKRLVVAPGSRAAGRRYLLEFVTAAIAAGIADDPNVPA